MSTLFSKIKLKRGSKSTVQNVVLDEAEPILVRGDTDEVDRLKIGDGETPVKDLETVAYISDIERIITEEEQVMFSTRLEFPNVGNPTKLYVAKDENKTYRWDEDHLIYRVVGSDYNDIKLINCGGANQ